MLGIMALRTILSLVAGLLTVGYPADGQNQPVVPTTLKAGLLARFDESSSKVLQLGEAIPADKYGWRPARGVRSISEVLVHVGLGNYYTTSDAGAKPSIQVADEQCITNKAEVLAFLRTSIDHMGSALNRLPEADLQHPATMFGQSTSYQNIYLSGIAHVHEHLGQLTAYARMNGVVPPWAHGH
jgi:uncharacterized damage-inducible protein DinB